MGDLQTELAAWLDARRFWDRPEDIEGSLRALLDAHATPSDAAEGEGCVVCHQSNPQHSGLCCNHRYDEQPPCRLCADSGDVDRNAGYRPCSHECNGCPACDPGLAPAPDADRDVARLTEEDDGPECETCGKTTCPDAQLVAFSAPVDCEYAPIYEALKDAKDCDYGCARDLTNQGIRLYVVPAVERILTAHAPASEVEQHVVHVTATPVAEDVVWCEECEEWVTPDLDAGRVEWGHRYPDGSVIADSSEVVARSRAAISRVDARRQLVLVRRTVGEWEVVGDE